MPDVTGMQVFFQRLRLGQLLHDAALVLGGELCRRAVGFDALLYPKTLGAVADKHVFKADVAAVGITQRLHQVAQGDSFRADKGAGTDHGVQIGLGEVIVAGLKFGHRRPRYALERIERRPARAGNPVRGHQQQSRYLQALGRPAVLHQGAAAQLAQLGALDE